MPITRRTALKTLVGAGAATVLPKPVHARGAKHASQEAVAMLYDPTRCIGCRACVEGCAEANGCDPETAVLENAALTPAALTVLNSYEVGGVQTFRKAQCMHCVDPACVSACMLAAMVKNEDGSVTWNGDLCVGCRYCGIGCPFNIPRFEWDTPLPKLTKCELCPERRAQGLEPACVEKCLRGALIFGRREDLIAEGHARIAAEPSKYESKIYGEHDGGGTSVLYLSKAGVSFQAMGLPELGDVSVPYGPEKLQHTIYKGMMAPMALLATFVAVVKRNKKRLAEEEAASPEPHVHEAPVGGRILTWPFMVLGLLTSVAVGLLVWRFVFGLGSVTALNDGYTKGLWLTFNVVVGTALACGGYGLAILVYLMNRGKYHPLVRSAMLVSALGYTGGGLTVLFDLGRTWNVYGLFVYPQQWNFNSILLEVALCVMLYTGVLWVEIAPGLIRGWKESGQDGLRKVAEFMSPKVEKALPYAISVGLLLPTMHQSSLGSLMMLAGSKLHPLWQTPLLPLLFLISCVAMGYAGATLEAAITSKAFRRPVEIGMLRTLARPIVMVILAYLVLRAADVMWRDQMMAIWRMDRFTALFAVEMGLFTAAAMVLLAWGRRAGIGALVGVAVMVALGGGLYRFSTFLFAFDPGPQWTYWPSVSEIMVTVGLVAGQVMGYIFLVKKFPILRGAPTHHTHQPEPAGSDEVRMRRSPRPAIAAALVLLGLLLAAATQLNAQNRPRGADLRCLSPNPEHCLPEPMPGDEPHQAVCATCHNLQTQPTFADAAKTCASANCHTKVETLTPFHRGLRQATLQNCIGCHPAHDAKIRTGGANCSTCHVKGGAMPANSTASPARGSGRTVTPNVVFRHERHEGVQCSSCHSTTQRHGATTVRRLQECRSCHHRAPVAVNCTNCHTVQEMRGVNSTVKRTFEMQVGSLNRPTRTLPFEHAAHLNADCATCHTGGLEMKPKTAACSTCHEQHHQPTANCSTCHVKPADGAHTRDVHLGCAGAGCHSNAASPIMDAPRTRQLCLACHTDRAVDHKPGNCADCHKLPKARARTDHAAVPRTDRAAVPRTDHAAVPRTESLPNRPRAP
jgi:Ni/Fe-hydrogenase subunit HybB-like protein/Fe-S-cluster-containing dehydrogenase component